MTSEDIKHQLIIISSSVPFPPVSLQKQVVLFADVAGVHVFITGESLHCFLVGWCTNKSYVIATSDLWLFIHASNLLSLNSPYPLPYKNLALVSRIGSRRVTHRPGDCMEELSGGHSSGPDHQQHGRATAVASDPATKATTLHWRGGWLRRR